MVGWEEDLNREDGGHFLVEDHQGVLGKRRGDGDIANPQYFEPQSEFRPLFVQGKLLQTFDNTILDVEKQQ
eukprot:CAMPEP_0184480420 /NCGR_PEP_ID=MMETSP0113_2-20130426/1934_1 /TAXON_ID=91329 /ORGANISM="Norrisiella sphaerica, Strain BC52" /LENGTH=70 /DNA_ID=CAMNT_0026858899 /DNA_START=319 /DNA_END=531 /DNA_ORIENTATION=-